MRMRYLSVGAPGRPRSQTSEPDRAAHWGPALLRWYVAATFLGFHGRHKAQELLGGDLGFVQTVAALGLPAPAMFAALAVATQLGAGVCLLLGVATRPAALALAVTMVFAIAEKWPSGFLAIEPALTYLTICVVLTVTGAGARSVDTRFEPFVRAWIGRRLHRQPNARQRAGVPTVLLAGGMLAGAHALGVRAARVQSHVSQSDALSNPASVAIQTGPGDAAPWAGLPDLCGRSLDHFTVAPITSPPMRVRDVQRVICPASPGAAHRAMH